MGFFRKLLGLEPAAIPRPAPISAPSSPVRLEGPGTFRVDVVGESRHEQAFDAYFGPRSRAGVEAQVDVTLCYEDDNPYDPQAVCVKLAGRPVGYLRRDAAATFRARTADHQAIEFTVDAVVRGGWERSGDRGGYGVWVDL